jgi:hypothetical protein
MKSHNTTSRVDSAWAHSDFGSGEMVLRYGDAVYEVWFNQ